MLLSALAIIVILFYVTFILDAWRGYGSRYRLTDFAPDNRLQWPRVSIVVAARNEERNIAHGVGSLLTLDYPELELVVVNDRSIDRTGAILAELSRHDPRLTIVDIETLPDGWLGKNWALQRGAANATGKYILFTDADVIFEPTALKRATEFMESHDTDHLSCAPQIIGGTIPLRIFVASFAVFFSLYARPWRAKDPKSRAHVGVGAFNLVRTELYRRVGGHEKIAMRPDDDVKLGKILKAAGGRAAFLTGDDLIRVEWYANLREAAHGLEKNAFSGVEYSYPLLIAATISQLAFTVWPFVAVLVTSGVTRQLNIAAATVIVLIAAYYARRSGMSVAYGVTFPLASLIFAFILWNAAIRNGVSGGIRWRDTFYPLKALRANRV